MFKRLCVYVIPQAESRPTARCASDGPAREAGPRAAAPRRHEQTSVPSETGRPLLRLSRRGRPAIPSEPFRQRRSSGWCRRRAFTSQPREQGHVRIALTPKPRQERAPGRCGLGAGRRALRARRYHLAVRAAAARGEACAPRVSGAPARPRPRERRWRERRRGGGPPLRAEPPPSRAGPADLGGVGSNSAEGRRTLRQWRVLSPRPPFRACPAAVRQPRPMPAACLSGKI